MVYLYASKAGVDRQLVATFDSSEQLLAYVGWATLVKGAGGEGKFEQGSVLAGWKKWEMLGQPLRPDDPIESVFHNPSPNML